MFIYISHYSVCYLALCLVMVVPTTPATIAPSASPFLFPQQHITQGHVIMNISPNDSPLNPDSVQVWEKVSASKIQYNIIELIGGDRLESLSVSVTMNNQEPPYSNLNVTVPTTTAPTSNSSFNNEQAPNLRRALGRKLETNLNIVFAVDIFIRSAIQDHPIYDYIQGAFDSQDDQSTYLQTLQANDDAFAEALRFNVLLPYDPPTSAPPMRDTDSHGALFGIIAGLVTLALSGMVALCVVCKRRRKAEKFSKGAYPPVIQGGDIIASTRDIASEIDVQDKSDISTLGDPIPKHLRVTSVQRSATAEDSFSVDYDFQKNYMRSGFSSTPSVPDGLHDDNNNIFVDEDDLTLERQYIEYQRRQNNDEREQSSNPTSGMFWQTSTTGALGSNSSPSSALETSVSDDWRMGNTHITEHDHTNNDKNRQRLVGQKVLHDI